MMNNPVFHYLFAQYKLLMAQGLDDTDEAVHLFGEMIAYAPPEYLDAAHDIAVEMKLMPKLPDGYSDDGEPMFNLESTCKRLGIKPDDVPDYILKKAYTGTVHKVN